MRLTCPNCDAQYEVPDDVIPQDGRDVQCSNCGNTWFQAHADQLAKADETGETGEETAAWSPETPESETLNDAETNSPEPAETPATDAPVSMAADAPDEVLAEAVKAAIRRARPGATTRTQDDDAPKSETEEPSNVADEPARSLDDAFEDDLDAALNADAALEERSDEMPFEEPAEEVQERHSEEPSTEDDIYYEPSADVDHQADNDDAQEPKRRTIDPTVANILQEEAAFEAERRAKDSGLESQPDLGLDEPMDDAAKRAKQARERMARMRGIPAEAADQPIEPIPANSRRDLLPDIEEINSTLRATEDRAPEEQPDGRPTIAQRRAGGRRMGFALALLLIAAGALAYTRPELITDNIPGSDGLVAGFINFIDAMRLRLDSLMTSLKIWLDGMSSE